MASDLTVSGLIATGGVRSVVLTWANGPDACLPYLAWGGVEVWSATSNDRDLAALVGTATGRANTFTHAGIAAGARWYWVRAIDVNDLPGPWHPADADAGVPATATDATPGPGSVTEEMLADGAVSPRTFIVGFTGVEIGPAFPTEGNYVGRMFFRTTDSMLYRFDGTGFVATLPTGNLTGQIQAGQLAVNSVNANAIQAGAVIAAKISVANLGAINASLGLINAGTIYGAYIATANDPTRVELSSAANALRAFRSGGQVVTISGGQAGAGIPAYVHVIDNATGGALITAYNTGAGQALYAQSVGGPATIYALNSGGATALFGQATAGNIGVYGQTQAGAGVKGFASGAGDGISGESTAGAGVRGNGIAGIVGNVAISSNISVRADLANVPGAGKMQAASYINFTGVHEELMDRAAAPEPGDIMVDTGSVFAADVVNATSVVCVSDRPMARGVVGAFVERFRLGEAVPPALMDRSAPAGATAALAPDYAEMVNRFDVAAVAAVGEGQLNVCGEAGDIALGDLIVTSNLPGKGMRGDDATPLPYVVARARQAANFGRPDEVTRIAVIFMGG